MYKLLIILGLLAYVSAAPAETKQAGSVRQFNIPNLFLQGLLPGVFTTKAPEIKNPILNQIKPFVDPISNLVQPELGPVVNPINNQAGNIPIVNNLVKDCTDNFLLCLLTNADNFIQTKIKSLRE